MKNLLPLFILLFFVGCGEKPEKKDEVYGDFKVPKWNPNNFDIQVTPQKEKWNESEPIVLTMKVTNITKKTASFGIMVGYWIDQWSFSDPRFYIHTLVVLKNYPKVIELKPGESYEMTTRGWLRAKTTKEIERITFDVGFSGLRRNKEGKLITNESIEGLEDHFSILSYRHPDAIISSPLTIEIHKNPEQNQPEQDNPITRP